MTRPVLAFAFLCLVFGTTFGAIAIGLRDGWPPLLSAGVRFALGGALVLGLAALRGELRRLSLSELGAIALVGLTTTSLTFGVLYVAEGVLPSSLAALIWAAAPPFSFGLAVALGRRRADGPSLAGVGLGTAGVALVVGVGGTHAGHAGVLAALAVLGAALTYVAGLTLSRDLAGRIPTFALAGGQQLLGGLALLVASAVLEHRGPERLDAPGLLALAYLAVVASAGAHTVMVWLSGVAGPTFTSSWTYVAPFVALLAGALMLHEPVGPSAWAGGVLVVLGAVALNAGVVRRLSRGAGPGAVSAPGAR